MASSSSSSCEYDVFLSFRGEDTRYNFTNHLHTALCKKKIRTFIDNEEVRPGDEISPALLNSIQGSKISIVIFSKDYASSKWCLNELVKIHECHKRIGQMVVPVFYHVNPSDVRKQAGSFKDAFVKHEKMFMHKPKGPEKVQEWRDVLTNISNLSGLATNEIRHEARLVELIVNDILEKLENITVSTDYDGLVGLKSRIEHIKSLLCVGLPDFPVIGIWGMGGIGKTTLAGAIFNQISREFEAKCFIANVGAVSEKGDGLIHLRDQILSVLFEKAIKVTTPDLPKNIRERLQRMKVFIVLDDVNKVGQLQYLVGQLQNLPDGLSRFSPGSRIVITTRDRGVLENYGVLKTKIYEVERLENPEAFVLFNNFAFKQNCCLAEKMLESSKRILDYAKGNPLALRVLGSFFHQKSEPDWENALKNLKLISDPDIYDVLKISYNELKTEQMSIFLDIACFFVGADKDFVMRLLEASNYALNVLVDKSLITISLSNTLQMHDLWQEMGREIVRQESVKEPGRRSRLWDHEDAFHVLKKNEGTDAIEGIFLNLSKTEDIHLTSEAFGNMKNLRLLRFYMPKNYDGVPIASSKMHLDQGLKYLSAKLRYLHWHEYPLKELPSDFEPENLTELNLPYSKVEILWKRTKNAGKLKFIDLRHSQYLRRMPGLSETPKLEQMNLLKCTKLAIIPSSIENFNNLSTLCLQGCTSLRSFPSEIHFACQVTIDFSHCVNLTKFPHISGKITKLDLRETAIKEVSSSIERLTDLIELDLSNCTRLKRLSTGICKLKSLSLLLLNGCLSLESFPEILEKMENLKCIKLERTAIAELPSSIENLEGLKTLVLDGCSKLDKLPDNIDNLKSLSYLSGRGSAISQLPSFIADSNKLFTLEFSGCRGLVSLPPLLSGLSFLARLDLSDCALMAIPQGIGSLSSLEWLDLSGNNFESLPTSIKQLSRLRSLYLRNCSILQSLPELPFYLNYLNAENCNLLQFLPEIPLLERSFPSHSSFQFIFTNCLRLNENTNKKILADTLLRIQCIAILSITLSGVISHPPVDWVFESPAEMIDGASFFFPGSEIPFWFCNQRSGSSIAIQLPQHYCRRKLIGFAFCSVLDFKGVSSDRTRDFNDKCRLSYEINTPSGIHLRYDIRFSFRDIPCIDSDHALLEFIPLVRNSSFYLMDSFEFSVIPPEGLMVKYCGLCPVYKYPTDTETNPPDLFNLKFVAGINIESTEFRKLDGKAGTSGTTAGLAGSDEDELEPSPKQICRDQIITYQHIYLFSHILFTSVCPLSLF